MAEGMISTSQKRKRQRRRFFRKSLVILAEHGSWSWLLVPFLVGAGVAGRLHFAALLVLCGALAAFLMRQPATAWLRIRQGRGRRADEKLAAGWALGLALLATLCLVWLLLLGRTPLLWLLLPLAFLFTLYLGVAQINRSRTRTLWMELAGAAGLAALAPAAYVAATGRLDTTAWLLWAIMATQNAAGVLYVRLRLADRHEREMGRLPVLWGHLLGLAVVVATAAWGNVPWPVVLPFAGFLLRAVWTVAAPRPIANVKHFGFTEVGVEILSGLWIVASYLL